MAAGYVAVAGGMPWGGSRGAFDILQSYQEGASAIERLSTQNAQYLGWRLGSTNTPVLNKMENLKRAINNFFRLLIFNIFHET